MLYYILSFLFTKECWQLNQHYYCQNESIKESTINLQTSIVDLKDLIKGNKSWTEENARWLVALLIGILTVFASFITNTSQRKTSIKTINTQIQSSENIAVKNMRILKN